MKTADRMGRRPWPEQLSRSSPDLLDLRHGLLCGEGWLVGGFGVDPDSVEGLAEFGIGCDEGRCRIVIALACGGGIESGVDVEMGGDIE